MATLVSLLIKSEDKNESRTIENTLKIITGKSEDKETCTKIFLADFGKAPVEPKCALLRLLRVSGGPDAFETVRASINNNNTQIRETAIRTLCEWPNAEAAPDLLKLAQSSDNTITSIAALRGYISLIRDQGVSMEQKLAMARQAEQPAQRDEEKKLLLGVLGQIPSVEALSIATSYLDNPATQNEAILAILSISEAICQQNPAEVKQALQKVFDKSGNEDVTKRAKAILDKVN
jgi:hypothetical protein